MDPHHCVVSVCKYEPVNLCSYKNSRGFAPSSGAPQGPTLHCWDPRPKSHLSVPNPTLNFSHWFHQVAIEVRCHSLFTFLLPLLNTGFYVNVLKNSRPHLVLLGFQLKGGKCQKPSLYVFCIHGWVLVEHDGSTFL